MSPEQKALVIARYEIETVFLVAELIRGGVLPSQLNLDRLEVACRRLQKALLVFDARRAS
jgi:hypothetical protein